MTKNRFSKFWRQIQIFPDFHENRRYLHPDVEIEKSEFWESNFKKDQGQNIRPRITVGNRIKEKFLLKITVGNKIKGKFLLKITVGNKIKDYVFPLRLYPTTSVTWNYRW